MTSDSKIHSGPGLISAHRRLGQLAVERGWLTGEQLIRALDHQRRIGGRLGTCLLEMGAIDERQLIETLADQLGAPPVPIDALDRIPDAVTAFLSTELASRATAVPFAASAKTLSVATLEPRNLSLLDELAFASNRHIVPFIVTEVRLAAALERYYGLPSKPRFRHLLHRIEHDRYRWVEGSEALLDGEATPPKWNQQQTQTELAPTPPNTKTNAISMPSTKSPARPVRLDDSSAFELISAQLAQVESPRQLAEMLVDFMHRHFERRALLRVSGDTLLGWKAAGPDLDNAAFDEFRLDLAQPSVFSGLRREFQLYRGALPPVAAHFEFAKSWGGKLPETCMMWPVRIQNHLACILYGDRFTGDLDALDPALYPALAHQTALAMRRFIRDRKRRELD